MKRLYDDGGKLALEIRSGSLISQWVKLITFTLLWLLIGGGAIAQTRSIRCTKPEPTWINCRIIDNLFWGAIRKVQHVNGVQRVVLEEAIGYSDASQYPIYRVSLVLKYAQKVPVTDWERRWDDTNRIRQSLEQFLRSDVTTYAMDLNAYRNLFGVLFLGFFMLITTSVLTASPYQIRLIADKTTQQAILISQWFLRGTRREFLSLDQLTLRLQEEEDSDGDCYYSISLYYDRPAQPHQQYRLAYSRQKNSIVEYWRTHPDLQSLKEFVRCEEKWLN